MRDYEARFVISFFQHCQPSPLGEGFFFALPIADRIGERRALTGLPNALDAWSAYRKYREA